MSQVYYPAVFHKAEPDETGYWIEFPDLPGCLSEGDTIEESYEMAKEALGLYLDTDGDLYPRDFNQPSDIELIKNKFPNEIIMLIEYDSLKYAQKYKTKAIKKTLTIPEWLNDEAMKRGLNFSQALQEILMSKLNALQDCNGLSKQK